MVLQQSFKSATNPLSAVSDQQLVLQVNELRRKLEAGSSGQAGATAKQQQERHARDKASWEQRHAEALQDAQESVQVRTFICIHASAWVQVPDARHLVASRVAAHQCVALPASDQTTRLFMAKIGLMRL